MVIFVSSTREQEMSLKPSYGSRTLPLLHMLCVPGTVTAAAGCVPCSTCLPWDQEWPYFSEQNLVSCGL